MAARVFVANEQSHQPVDCAAWARLAEQALAAEGVDEGELSVLFVDRETITSLNERFLGHEGATDVLSFPIDEVRSVPAAPEPSAPGSHRSGDEDDDDGGDAPVLIGDVVICPDVAFANAPEHAGTYEDELALLLVHGILHVLGRDHEVEEEAEEMEARERELLSAFHRPGQAPFAP